MYCARKSKIRTPRNTALIKPMPRHAKATVIVCVMAGSRYLSMATWNSLGGANSSGVTMATSASARTTRHRYGRRYCSSRRIKCASYGLPSASSS